MKDNNKNIFATLILGASLIVASLIYAFANRYEIAKNGNARIDKWTGTIELVHQKK